MFTFIFSCVVLSVEGEDVFRKFRLGYLRRQRPNDRRIRRSNDEAVSSSTSVTSFSSSLNSARNPSTIKVHPRYELTDQERQIRRQLEDEVALPEEDKRKLLEQKNRIISEPVDALSKEDTKNSNGFTYPEETTPKRHLAEETDNKPTDKTPPENIYEAEGGLAAEAVDSKTVDSKNLGEMKPSESLSRSLSGNSAEGSSAEASTSQQDFPSQEKRIEKRIDRLGDFKTRSYYDIAKQRVFGDEQVHVFVNKVWPFGNPQETYSYYDFGFCMPPVTTLQWMSVGQILKGDRLINSLYDISLKNKETLECTDEEMKEDDDRERRNRLKKGGGSGMRNLIYDETDLFAGRHDEKVKEKDNDNTHKNSEKNRNKDSDKRRRISESTEKETAVPKSEAEKQEDLAEKINEERHKHIEEHIENEKNHEKNHGKKENLTDDSRMEDCGDRIHARNIRKICTKNPTSEEIALWRAAIVEEYQIEFYVGELPVIFSMGYMNDIENSIIIGDDDMLFSPQYYSSTGTTSDSFSSSEYEKLLSSVLDEGSSYKLEKKIYDQKDPRKLVSFADDSSSSQEGRSGDRRRLTEDEMYDANTIARKLADNTNNSEDNTNNSEDNTNSEDNKNEGNTYERSSSSRFYLRTHYAFEIGYNNENMVVSAFLREGHSKDFTDITRLTEGMGINFSYSLRFFYIDGIDSFEDALELQTKAMGHYSRNIAMDIHWKSISYAFLLVIIIFIIVLIMIIHLIRKDIERYLQIPDSPRGGDLSSGGMQIIGGMQIDSGWKLLHADVFRNPKLKLLFCSLIGSGTQLTVMLISVILLGCFTHTFFHRGAMLTTGVFFYLGSSLIGAYCSAKLYKSFAGQKWLWNVALTMLSFSAPLILTWSFLNTVAILKGSTAAYPFGTVILILSIFVCVTLPLTCIGGVLGRQAGSEEIYPCKTNKLAREIPKTVHFLESSFFHCAICGFLSFTSIHFELQYLLRSVWGERVYTLYGMLLLAVILLLMVACEITVVMIYLQFNRENWKWWWRSFLGGFTTGIYIYVYCIYFYFFKSKMSGFLQTSFFFLYSGVLCYGIGLLVGACTHTIARWFVIFLFSRIKAE